MPWLRAFDIATGLPSGLTDPAAVASALLAAHPGGVTVDDPDAGRVEGVFDLGRFIADSDAWLADRSATVDRGALTRGQDRTVAEFDVTMDGTGGPFVLPLAIAAEPDPVRQALAVRIYHSHWPLLGRHIVRTPLLARDPDAHESDIVGEYQSALAAGDADRITACFEPDGCFREPAGPEHRVCGRTALLPFFRGFFAVGGGILLEHCTVTEDGVRTALEFNAVRWGATDMPHQAGIAVYERGRSGRLAHARIYDDVDPPL